MQSFIQLEKDCEAGMIRYYAAGIQTQNGFTGIVYGYEGGGEHSDDLIIGGKFIPHEFEDGEVMDNDFREVLFNKALATDGFDQDCWAEIWPTIIYNDLTMKYYAVRKDEFWLGIHQTGQVFIPPSYASTTWDEAPTGQWELKEFMEEFNISKEWIMEEGEDNE